MTHNGRLLARLTGRIQGLLDRLNLHFHFDEAETCKPRSGSTLEVAQAVGESGHRRPTAQRLYQTRRLSSGGGLAGKSRRSTAGPKVYHDEFVKRALADWRGGSTRVLRLELRVGRLLEVIAGGQAMRVAITDRPHEVL